jgi:hypothetical protein
VPVEVLNTGVSGYGTDSELLFYLNEGYKYRADVVLLVFNTSNDILENHNGLMRGTGFPYPDKPYFDFQDGRLQVQRFPLPEQKPKARALAYAQRVLTRHSTLYRLLPALNLRLHRNRVPPPCRRCRAPRLPPYLRINWKNGATPGASRGPVLRLRQAVEPAAPSPPSPHNAKEEVPSVKWTLREPVAQGSVGVDKRTG